MGVRHTIAADALRGSRGRGMSDTPEGQRMRIRVTAESAMPVSGVPGPVMPEGAAEPMPLSVLIADIVHETAGYEGLDVVDRDTQNAGVELALLTQALAWLRRVERAEAELAKAREAIAAAIPLLEEITAQTPEMRQALARLRAAGE